MASHRSSGSQNSRHGTRVPSQRQLRAGELVRHVVVEVLTREEIHHEVLAGISITVRPPAIFCPWEGRMQTKSWLH